MGPCESLRKLGHAVALVLCCSAAGMALAGGGEDDADPWPTFRLELDVPAGTSPTILVETDSSGLYRFIQTGPGAYKLVNFDSGSLFELKPVGGAATPAIRVINGGGSNDTEPWPTLGIGWYVGGQPSSSLSLSLGESSSCSTCNQVDIDWEE